MTNVPPVRRRRISAAVALALVVVTGLVVIRLPDPWGDMGGDLLYAVALYALLVIVVPRAQPLTIGAVTLAACSGVEFLQATPWGEVIVEAIPASRWVIGTTFAARDLVLYATGSVLAVVVDRALHTRAVRATEGSTTAP